MEQTTSATMPWLALGGFYRLFPEYLDPDRSKAAVQAGVNRLLRMATDEGGLSYWPGGQEPSFWGSAYGGLMLLRARDAGAQVPNEIIDKLLAYLSKQLRGLDQENDFYRITDSALALYTLAKGGKPEPSYQNLLHSRRARLPQTARLYTALAMCLTETPHSQIKEIIDWMPPEARKKAAAKKAGPRPLFARAPEPEWTHWAGSLPDMALRLIVYTHLGLTEDAEELTQSILDRRNGSGGWGNTYANAWMLTGLTAYERSLQADAGPVHLKLQWGQTTIPLVMAADLTPSQATLELEESKTASPLHLTVENGNTAFARIETRGFPSRLEFAGENHGYAIGRTYQKLLPDGGTAEASDLRVGDMVVVNLELGIDGGDRFLVIDDPLPSVLEAINPAFETQNAGRGRSALANVQSWFCDHREIRSDRALFFTNYAPTQGTFQIRYLARVIAEGDTIAPSARIEAMYQPHRYGLSPTQRLRTLPAAAGQVAGR